MAKRGLNIARILFAAKYMPYMPTEEELRQEIEQQKQFFLDQHKWHNPLALRVNISSLTDVKQ